MINYNDIPSSSHKPLPSPDTIRCKQAATKAQLQFVQKSRNTICNITQGLDDKLAVIVGPCSIHNIEAANEYAEKLSMEQKRLGEDIFIIMRSYFEKPRTNTGWKGLISDPYLDGSNDIIHGLKLARGLLLNLADKEIPAGGEYLNRINQLSLLDLMTWYAIGARTTESQPHREIASDLPTPVGFKNNREGDISVAIDAIKTAKISHDFCSMDSLGKPAIISSKGNKNCHIILRGAKSGPNFSLKHRNEATLQMRQAGIKPYFMIDCSHDNSERDHRKQIEVAKTLATDISLGENNLCGIMLESNLVAGKQNPNNNKNLCFGQSITDACISWDETLPILDLLALSVSKRRKINRRTA